MRDTKAPPSLPRWHSLKSNPLTSAAMNVWGRQVTARTVGTWAFCAATGRCGTNTLAEMMAAHPDVCALHEPYPQPSDRMLAGFARGETADISRYWAGEKFPRVAYAARGHKAYIETSHLFIHTFAERAWETFGKRLKVIYLHRDVDQTARSFLQRGQDPANDPWLIHPAARNVVLDVARDVAPGAPFDDAYLRLVWYCHEISAQALAFHRRHPEVSLLDLATEDLNNRNAIARLLEDLGLTPSEAVLATCGSRHNASAKTPQPLTGLDAGKLADFRALLADRFAANGFVVPDTLA